MDDAELRLLDQALRRATAAGSGSALDAALSELGWSDALAVAPEAACRLLFAAQGEAGVTSSALALVVAAGLGEQPPTPAVLLPGAGAAHPPARLAEDRVVVDGLLVAGAGRPAHVLTAASTDRDSCVLLSLPTARLQLRPLAGFDATLGLVAVTGHAPAVDPAPLTQWPVAVRLARLALGHELVGAGRAMLTLARTHALDREQFGRPIAGFQAVRHRLAETLVALESAQALLDATDLDQTTVAAAMAKAAAGRAARTAARHCQQVLAGIGFTTEHPFHRLVRRVLVLDQLFGSTHLLTRELGEQVLADGRLPAPLQL